MDAENPMVDAVERAFVDDLKDRIQRVRQTDDQIKEFAKEEKAKEKKRKGVELFMG